MKPNLSNCARGRILAHARYRLTRKTYSLSTSLDWRPAPIHTLFAETF